MENNSTKLNHFSIGSTNTCLPAILIVCLYVCCFAQQVSAAIVTSGDITPGDPATWGRYTFGYIGKNSSGTLGINGGSDVSLYNGYIGYYLGSAGEVTVDGVGSTFYGDYLTIGNGGSGVLNISNGGRVDDINCYIGSAGTVTVDGTGSLWKSNQLTVSGNGNSSLNITNGGKVRNTTDTINSQQGSTVTVDGVGSMWRNDSLITIGSTGNGIANIVNGGAVKSNNSYLGRDSGSTGAVTIGAGSKWTNYVDIYVGDEGSGILSISDGGLMSVAGSLYIDNNGGGDSFVDIASGGMLALLGDADDSLAEFLGLIEGTDAIRYWDEPTMNWADITGATNDIDYTLSYITEGDLDGYTMLTVIPEPCTLILLGLGGLALRRRRA